ncbi:hypothetical protein N322_01942, partial [Cariama cristata]
SIPECWSFHVKSRHPRCTLLFLLLQDLILCRGGERKKILKIKADHVLSAIQE